MEPVGFSELLRRGARETLAADLGIDPSEMERPTDGKPTVTPYKTAKKGHKHWEIHRITHASGLPDYYEHRDRHAKGEWKHGLPEGLKKADVAPAEAGFSPSAESESPEGRSSQRSAATSPTETFQPAGTVTLESAATTPEILQAVAQYIQPGCPPDSVPDSETLATWVTNECPSDVRAAADTLLMAIWKRSAGWLVSGNGEPGSPPRRLIASLKDVLDGPEEVVVPGTLSILELERVHSAWLGVIVDRPMHPLVPLVLMWQQRPEALKPETNALRIMPKGLMNAAPSAVYVDEPLYDPALLPMTGHAEDADSLQLGLFPTADGESDLPPATPLILASAAGFGALKLGRGARIDKRLLIYSLLFMPLDQRRPGGRYEWRPTLEELIQLLWTKETWRPNKHAKALEQAFDAVTIAKIRLPDGRTWRPVVARGMPNPNDLSSHAVIQIEVPDLSNRGPSLNFAGLIADGRISDPAFDLWLSLAYLWDDAKSRNGGFRVYATRPKALRNEQGYLLDAKGAVILGHPNNPFGKAGKLSWKPGNTPQRDWRHPQAVLSGEERHPRADKVPALYPDARRRLAYGVKEQPDKAHRARERNKANELLQRLESAGRVVIERDDKLWRILEPGPIPNEPPVA
ncbi:MAG: hypothetical protein OXP66_11725 [Candidatus Tectomicrobia bacterium]|nr:hypothetical protein [Candidatus Tectomicrobia bacterium]